MPYHQLALTTSIPDYQPTGEHDVPQLAHINYRKEAVMMYIAFKGRSLWKRFGKTNSIDDLEAALEHYNLVGDLAHDIQTSFSADESKMNLGSTTIDYFEQGVGVALDLYRKTGKAYYANKALNFMEQAKSLTLLQAVQANQIEHYQGVPIQEIEREKQLRRKILELEKSIYTTQLEPEGKAETIHQLNQELLATYQSVEDLDDRLRKNHPKYFNLKLNRPKLSIDIIQELLEVEETMVSYFVGTDSIYLLSIDSSHFQFHTLLKPANLEGQIQQFHQAMTGFRHQKEIPVNQYLDPANQLFQNLMGPIYSELNRKVIIVPHSSLNLIPFGALLSDRGSGLSDSSFQKFPFLIKDHLFSYSYSISLWQLLKKESDHVKEVKKKVLAMAPSFEPFNNNKNVETDPLVTRGFLNKMGPLIFNETEVQAIKKILPAHVFIGAKANKQNFIKRAEQYQILHLASHSMVNHEAPNYSFISFSQLQDTIDYNEVLFVNELYGLTLNADLVVLSACETGVGKIREGEGILSLARGFLYAGAKSIVTTLWNIDDHRTEKFMEYFYKYLESGLPVDEALWRSKMAFIERSNTFANPGFWAPFITVGQNSTIDIQKPFWQFW